MEVDIMMEDKEFFEREITPNIAKLNEEVKIMIRGRVPIEKIYNYILKKSLTYEERYISLFLFGLSYKWYKEDNNLR